MAVTTSNNTLRRCKLDSKSISSHKYSEPRNQLMGIDPYSYDIAFEGCCCSECSERLREVSAARPVTVTGNSLLHIHLARPDGYDIEFVRTLLMISEDMKTLLWIGNLNGDIPLHLAARNGHLDAVRLFIQKADTRLQEMLTCTNKNKDTALHEASRQKHSEVVKLLIQADKLCPYYANNDHETPLYLAAESGSDEVVDTIVDHYMGLELLYGGPCGRNALHAAILSGRPGMVHLLLSKNRTLLKQKDDRGMTAFHFAASVEDGKYIDTLLEYDENENSAVYIQDELGRTALHIGVMLGKFDHVKKLATSHPDLCEVVDNRHKNVVHYIAKMTSCPVQLGHFSNECGIYWRALINDKDVDGNTPFHVSAQAICSNGTNCFCNPLPGDAHFFMMASRAFNKNNQTAGDILAAHNTKDFECSKRLTIKQHILRRIRRPANRMIAFDNGVLAKLFKPITAQDENERVSNIQKRGETHLIVAILIVTLSFAAGIAVPGGPNQELGPDQGTALLTRKTAFKAFMVSDAIAMTLSTSSTLMYFLLFMSEGRVATLLYFSLGGALNILSLGGVVIAFMAGVYATIYQSKTLAAGVLIIGSFLFIIYFIVLASALYGYYFISLTEWLRFRPDHNKFRRTV